MRNITLVNGSTTGPIRFRWPCTGECASEQLRAYYEERLVVLVNVARVMPAQAQLLTHMGNHFESWFSFFDRRPSASDELADGTGDSSGGGEPQGVGWKPHLRRSDGPRIAVATRIRSYLIRGIVNRTAFFVDLFRLPR